MERATIILREMPSDTPEGKLRAFFDGLAGCKPVKGLRADVNDMWCVLWLRLRVLLVVVVGGVLFCDVVRCGCGCCWLLLLLWVVLGVCESPH